MSDHIELKLRTASAYDLAREAVDALERMRVWPTALNLELALRYVGDPAGPLAKAVEQLVSAGELTSDDFGEKLARDFLPRVRHQTEVSDAGSVLARQLEHVGGVLDQARLSNAEVVGSMTTAGAGLSAASTVAEAQQHIRDAAVVIETAENRAATYKAQLDASAAELAALREHLDRIQRDALTDALTNLASRRAFEQDIEAALAHHRASGQPFTLAMLDIDHFKTFNDTWGHQTGDQVIRFVGAALGALAARPRLAARYGGEEFAVILPREDARSAVSALETFRAEVAGRTLRRRDSGEDLGQVTVSIGVAQCLPGDTPATLVERADAALYASKRSGRNRTTCSPSRLVA